MPIDMSLAAKAPPRKTSNRVGTPASRQPVQSEAQSINSKRSQGLNGLAQLGQGIALMMGQYADAAAIGMHFPPIAAELANVADGSEMIAKPIDLIIEVGPYGALIAAGMPLVMQIMANHKMLDARKLHGQGVVPPEVLEAQMTAQMAKMQAQAMKEQQLAMREAQAAKAEYEEMMREPTREYSAV
jgi:hypothetical protein